MVEALVGALRELALLEDTYIFYTSDNGARRARAKERGSNAVCGRVAPRDGIKLYTQTSAASAPA